MSLQKEYFELVESRLFLHKKIKEAAGDADMIKNIESGLVFIDNRIREIEQLAISRLGGVPRHNP